MSSRDAFAIIILVHYYRTLEFADPVPFPKVFITEEIVTL